jgi:hypothetical protein
VPSPPRVFVRFDSWAGMGYRVSAEGFAMSNERSGPGIALMVMVYGPLLLWVAVCLLNHLGASTPTPAHQAALAGNTCVALLAGYIACRAVDRISGVT